MSPGFSTLLETWNKYGGEVVYQFKEQNPNSLPCWSLLFTKAEKDRLDIIHSVWLLEVREQMLKFGTKGLLWDKQPK